MTTFILDNLVKLLRQAAKDVSPNHKIEAILKEALHDPSKVQAGIPEFDENDVILFEDKTVSIWHCRFMPGWQVPAHDHQMSAIIGVYSGSEHNIFFENDPNGTIRESGRVILEAGQVLQIGASAIHAVACESEVPCCGIHVYLGALTEIDRSLFDIDNSKVLSFTDDNYERLTHGI